MDTPAAITSHKMSQPRRWLSPEMKRYQLKLGTANLAMGSAASGVFAYSVATGAIRTLSFDASASGVALGVASTLAYFLVTDAGLYWAHRTFHRPLLFRHIQRYHHRVTSPTAITAMAMHPVEFITYQSIMILPLFFVPLWGYGVIFTLLYQNWVALVDHSGIKLYAWFPWQPPSLFHDDHHLYFHVNYGQNMGQSQYGGQHGQSSQGGMMSRGRHIGRGPRGYKRSDERLTEEINEKLTQHPDINAEEIEVKVQSGEVTLTGTVEDRQTKRMIEDLVEDISGVNELHNQLRVTRHRGSMSQGSQSQQGGLSSSQGSMYQQSGLSGSQGSQGSQSLQSGSSSSLTGSDKGEHSSTGGAEKSRNNKTSS